MITSSYRYQRITLMAHLVLIAHYAVMPWWYIISTLLLGWVVSSLGHNLFAHRVLTHNHFKFGQRAQNIGHFLFAILNIGSIVTYCSVHLKHHKYSGKHKDPHDYKRIGVIRAILNLWDKYYIPEKTTYRRFLEDPLCKWWHDRHYTIALFSAVLIPYTIVVSFWLQKVLVIVVHMPCLGSKSANTKDSSVNVWWLKPIMLGEELHNNHHLYAGHANHNVNRTWKDFDPMYYIGKWIEKNI